MIVCDGADLEIDSGDQPDQATEREFLGELAREIRAATRIPSRGVMAGGPAERQRPRSVRVEPSWSLRALRYRPRGGFRNDSGDPNRVRTCDLRFRKAPL